MSMSFMYFYTVHPIAIKFWKVVDYILAMVCIKKKFWKINQKVRNLYIIK